jgi:vacuolar-type H+-ATPase subunit H
MSQSALERIQDLERQKLAIIAEAEAAAVARISDALEELKALVREHLKAAGAPRR